MISFIDLYNVYYRLNHHYTKITVVRLSVCLSELICKNGRSPETSGVENELAITEQVKSCSSTRLVADCKPTKFAASSESSSSFFGALEL